MHKGEGLSEKPLGKGLFHCQNVWSGRGPAGQCRLLESAPSLLNDALQVCTAEYFVLGWVFEGGGELLLNRQFVGISPQLFIFLPNFDQSNSPEKRFRRWNKMY